MNWIDAELVLISLAAMLSPTTLTFSVLVLVLGDRPRRAGVFFYLGALTATLTVGVVAAFVLGDIAASPTSSPKTWVAIIDIIAAILLLVWVVRMLRRPVDPRKLDGMVAQISKLPSSPAVAIIGAGAALANPGGFIPLALKDVSETDPSAGEYIVEWVFFSFVSLLPLAFALAMLFLAPDHTRRVLVRVRDWLVHNVMKVAAAIVALLALSLLRNGVAGIAS